tara:strand:+ start:6944 stop:7525 length:582 start_codon:yes stop_codon:yes gene_type:complete
LIKNPKLKKIILDSINLKKKLIEQEIEINKSIIQIYKSIHNGGKIILCGNGGSAADAEHLAAEFIVRLKPNFNRASIPAVSLSSNTSIITACGNDYGFKKIFTRSLAGLYKKNDILIALSTSGNSENIIDVLRYCKKNKIKSIGFLGNNGGKAKKYCNTSIVIKSSNTARIQELHIFLGHFIFESVENLLFKK